MNNTQYNNINQANIPAIITNGNFTQHYNQVMRQPQFHHPQNLNLIKQQAFRQPNYNNQMTYSPMNSNHSGYKSTGQRAPTYFTQQPVHYKGSPSFNTAENTPKQNLFRSFKPTSANRSPMNNVGQSSYLQQLACQRRMPFSNDNPNSNNFIGSPQNSNLMGLKQLASQFSTTGFAGNQLNNFNLPETIPKKRNNQLQQAQQDSLKKKPKTKQYHKKRYRKLQKRLIKDIKKKYDNSKQLQAMFPDIEAALNNVLCFKQLLKLCSLNWFDGAFDRKASIVHIFGPLLIEEVKQSQAEKVSNLRFNLGKASLARISPSSGERGIQEVDGENRENEGSETGSMTTDQ